MSPWIAIPGENNGLWRYRTGQLNVSETETTELIKEFLIYANKLNINL